MIDQKKVALIEYINPTVKTICQIKMVMGKKKFVLISLNELKTQLNNL
jgi:hypothetical protein